MAGPGGEKRKRRCVMATDAEWSRMRGKAQEEGTSCSEFIVRRCLADGTPAALAPALQVPELRHIARSVLALGDMECQSAFNIDPQSACKIDPPEWHGGGCPGSQ